LIELFTLKIIKHVAKGLNLNTIKLPEEINRMILLDNYAYKGNQ